MRGRLFAALLLACHTSCSAQNTTDAARTLVDVQGQSGKFTVYSDKLGKDSGVQITMDALREVDAGGAAVGASGSTKHSIQTFASQAFIIAEAVEVLLGTGSKSVNATKISFSSTISTIGKIKVDTFVMKAGGQVGPPNETWAVRMGDLKWSIELSQWTWCGCSKGNANEVGQFVDFDVSVKGLSTPTSKGGSNKTLALGGGLTLELSNQVLVDGNWTAMPAGYPMMTTNGASITFTFRFPKFNTSALYDPVITGVQDQTISITNNAIAVATSPVALMSIMAVAALVV